MHCAEVWLMQDAISFGNEDMPKQMLMGEKVGNNLHMTSAAQSQEQSLNWLTCLYQRSFTKQVQK